MQFKTVYSEKVGRSVRISNFSIEDLLKLVEFIGESYVIVNNDLNKNGD